MKRFTETSAQANDPIRIEHVFAEKPNGGIVEDPGFDAPESTAVYADGAKYKVIKAYRLYKANAAADTNIQILKGSGVKVGDVIATGKKGVAATAVDTTNDNYDVVTVTLGVDVAKGVALYQAAAASATAAVPVGTPVFVLGNVAPGNVGDVPVRLVNGANLRKETANISAEVVALLGGITLV